jgi:hypothetical protein
MRHTDRWQKLNLEVEGELYTLDRKTEVLSVESNGARRTTLTIRVISTDNVMSLILALISCCQAKARVRWNDKILELTAHVIANGVTTFDGEFRWEYTIKLFG